MLDIVAGGLLLDPGRRTRAEEVSEAMRNDILSGAILPGERLGFPDVCQRYSASVGVTREALTSLVKQGLVRTIAHHGYRVSPISAKDVIDVGKARAMIEPLMLRESVLTADIEWEGKLLNAYHLVMSTPKVIGTSPEAAQWHDAHYAFHETLLVGCHNEVLLSIADMLFDKSELHRVWYDNLPNCDRDFSYERKAILDAALAHDAETAANELRGCIERTVALILDSLETAGF